MVTNVIKEKEDGRVQRMDLNLTGKNLLVTGAAKGLGRGIAFAAASEGVNIALHCHESEKEATETARIIKNSYKVKVTLVKGDLAKIEDVQNIKYLLSQEIGSIDFVVNNAGWAQYKSFFAYRPEEWKREVDVNFYGVLHLAHTFMPDMMEKKYGKFINIVGDSARTGDKNLVLSAAARGGAINLLKSLAQEVGQHNIQCNTLSLGLFDTGQMQFDEETMRKIVRQYPLKRIGEINDVTGMVLFLLASWSDWITGQVISVNGGHSMFG